MNAGLREIVRVALTRPERPDAAQLKSLAMQIRTLNAGRRKHTPADSLDQPVTGVIDTTAES